MRTLSIATVCATGLFLLAACGDEDQEAQQDSAADHIQQAWNSHVSTLADIHKLTARLEDECAQARGVDNSHAADAANAVSRELTREALMGVAQPRIDPETADTVGYQHIHRELWAAFNPVDDSAAPQVPDHNQVAVMFGEEFATAYVAAADAGGPLEINGDTPGIENVHLDGAATYIEYFTDGCAGAVANELYENDPESYFIQALEVAPNLNPYLLTNAKYLAIEQEWAECMRHDGYDLSYFGRESHLLAEYYADDPTTFEERQKELAAADASCVRRKDVNKRNRELFESVVVDYFESHELESKLADMRDVNEAVLQRGNAIVGDSLRWQ
ncbi:hypothetical protein [Natronoglycomyces albus]|uniref:Uncharacterized protein n=1 Tax=Natronoglycomyces albus TaxID=2811108 RepID=A0A895XG02_9ACTN|nr:hypothetical protein [Natronoglycomyces albus]QSB04791.1 hypothetical protein JQS30_13615 [Natronoglycomyces albus]